MILSRTLRLNLSRSEGNEAQPQTARGGCRTSAAAVFMEKVRNATEIACLSLAQAVGLDNPSKPPPGYFFMLTLLGSLFFSLPVSCDGSESRSVLP